MITNSSSQSGFALLLTILIIGVVLAVTLTMLSVSIKQIQLTADSRQSEIAFHAANAGLECVRHWRRSLSDLYEQGNNSVGINCFGESATPAQQVEDLMGNTNAGSATIDEDDSSAYKYFYQISWGELGARRCSQLRFIILNNSSDSTEDLELSNVTDFIAGYPRDVATCSPGGRCTIFSSQGYSSACPASGGNFALGTIQRDILVEF